MKGMNDLFKAAIDVCDHHMLDLELAGGVPRNLGILMDVDCIGGTDGGQLNSNLAIRRMSIFDEPGTSFADQVKAYRNPDIWVEGKPMPWEEPWYYESFTPDVALCVQRRDFDQHPGDLSCVIDGVLTGKVQEQNTDMEATVNQAVAQGMQGLIYRPCAAAVVMAQRQAAFIDINVNNGFIDLKKKYYTIGCNDVHPEAFEELFHDLVLYLWNTYFETVVLRHRV